jgi:hypothetical protein
MDSADAAGETPTGVAEIVAEDIPPNAKTNKGGKRLKKDKMTTEERAAEDAALEHNPEEAVGYVLTELSEHNQMTPFLQGS